MIGHPQQGGQKVGSMKDAPSPVRPWRVIASEISEENNPQRFTDLCRELESALDQQTTTLKKVGPTPPSQNRQVC